MTCFEHILQSILSKIGSPQKSHGSISSGGNTLPDNIMFAIQTDKPSRQAINMLNERSSQNAWNRPGPLQAQIPCMEIRTILPHFRQKTQEGGRLVRNMSQAWTRPSPEHTPREHVLALSTFQVNVARLGPCLGPENTALLGHVRLFRHGVVRTLAESSGPGPATKSDVDNIGRERTKNAPPMMPSGAQQSAYEIQDCPEDPI